MPSFLVSGTGSGLGKYLARKLDAHHFNRATLAPSETMPPAGYDTIIHAAWGMPGSGQTEHHYRAANRALAEALMAIPHLRFVFISSVDVMKPEADQTPYSRSKKDVENLLHSKDSNLLILRTGALLGPGMRHSQLLKVLRGDTAPLSLSPESTFAPVMYEDVLDQVRKPGTGIITIAPESLTLGQIAQAFGTTPQFGTYTYTTPVVPHSLPAPAPILFRLNGFVQARAWQDEASS